MIEASKFFLTEPLPSYFESFTEKALLQYLGENSWDGVASNYDTSSLLELLQTTATWLQKIVATYE